MLFNINAEIRIIVDILYTIRMATITESNGMNKPKVTAVTASTEDGVSLIHNICHSRSGIENGEYQADYRARFTVSLFWLLHHPFSKGNEIYSNLSARKQIVERSR